MGRHATDVIVVTGAAGFLGSRVVPLLRRRSPRAHVIAVVRHERSRALVRGVDVVGGDLRSARTWRRLPSSVTHVIHLAAAIPWDRRQATRPGVAIDNLAPIAHLVHESARWTDLRQVVYGSSVSVYHPGRLRLRESAPTQPSTVYGAAKLAGEQLLDVLTARGLAVASLRFSSLYGVGQYPGTVLPLLVDRARRGLRLELFNVRRVQDFLHVDDAAQATWLAYRKGAHGPFNVGSGRSVSMSALAREVLRTCGAGRGSRLVEDRRSVSDDAGIRLDIGRSRRVLGYRPRIRLRDGLKTLAV